MARVFRGKVAIPGEQMDVYLEALGQFERDKAPLRAQLEQYAGDFARTLAQPYAPKTVRKHTASLRCSWSSSAGVVSSAAQRGTPYLCAATRLCPAAQCATVEPAPLGCTDIRVSLRAEGAMKNLNARAWRTRGPRCGDGAAALRPCRDRSLLASLGLSVDLHGRLGPHDALSPEKGPGAP